MNPNRYGIIFLLGLVCALLSAQSALGVVYVDKDKPAGGDGTTWAKAFNSLVAAADSVGSTSAEFWIAEGTYNQSSTIVLGTNHNHSFYGGFVGNETSREQRDATKHKVVLDGQGSIQNVFKVTSHVNNVVFDGLTIQGGNANGPTTSDTGQGAGIHVGNISSLVINNCAFKNNTSRGVGGALALVNISSISITNSTFTGNETLELGGGAISMHWDGQGTKPIALIEECLFEKNQAIVDGGAIWSGYYPLTLRDSTFIDNSSVRIAGAVKIDYFSDSVNRIEGCLFLKNKVTGEGAGGALQVFEQSVVVENSVFAYNSSVDSGGAVGLHSGSNDAMIGIFSNCTFYGNTAGDYAGGMAIVDVPHTYLYNSIFWGNTGGLIWYGSPSNDYVGFGSTVLTSRYSNIETESARHHQDGSETKVGNFSADPMFVSPKGEDGVAGTSDDNFSISDGSPCTDRADGSNAPAKDIAARNRVDNPGVANQGTGSPNYADVGAYEGPWFPPQPAPTPGDNNIAPIMLLLTDKTLLKEDFESWPPAGWGIVNNSGSCDWVSSSATGFANYAGGAGNAATANSWWCGAGTSMNTDLMTPAINLSGVDTAELTFTTAYDDRNSVSPGFYSDYAIVQVSTNGGASPWTMLALWYMADIDANGPGERMSFDLSPFAGSSSVVIRFKYYSLNQYGWWMVDDVKVTAT